MNNGDKLVADIKKMKSILVAKAKRKGIFENFGQNEVRLLKDKYASMREGDSDSMRFVDEKIDSFESWCMNFDERQLRAERVK